MRNFAGQTLFNKFVGATDELTVNNQKIVIKEAEPFITQEHTKPGDHFGVDTGNTRSPVYFSAVPRENGTLKALHCANEKMGLQVYDEAVKSAGAHNKIGGFVRVAIQGCSLCGLEFTTDHCVEVPKKRCDFVADLFNAPKSQVVHTSSINQLAPIKTGGTTETGPLSPLNSPSNKYNQGSNL